MLIADKCSNTAKKITRSSDKYKDWAATHLQRFPNDAEYLKTGNAVLCGNHVILEEEISNITISPTLDTQELLPNRDLELTRRRLFQPSTSKDTLGPRAPKGMRLSPDLFSNSESETEENELTTTNVNLRKLNG